MVRSATLFLGAITVTVVGVGCSGGGSGGGGVNGIVTFSKAEPSAVSALAAFLTPGVSVSDPTSGLANGSCVAAVKSNPSGSLSTQFLDAGASLTLSGPAGSLSLTKQALGPIITYTATSSSANLFAPRGSYTLTGPGGTNVQAFSVGFGTPSDLTVTNPTGTVAINRTAALPIAWVSSGGSDPVVVFISQVNSSQATIGGLSCKFADSGSASIPAASLASLTADSANPGGNTSVEIGKETVTTVTVPGAGNTLAVGAATWAYGATVQ